MQYSFRAPASSYDDDGDVDEDGVDEDADVDAGAGAWQSTCSSIQRTGGRWGRPLLSDTYLRSHFYATPTPFYRIASLLIFRYKVSG